MHKDLKKTAAERGFSNKKVSGIVSPMEEFEPRKKKIMSQDIFRKIAEEIPGREKFPYLNEEERAKKKVLFLPEGFPYLPFDTAKNSLKIALFSPYSGPMAKTRIVVGQPPEIISFRLAAFFIEIWARRPPALAVSG